MVIGEFGVSIILFLAPTVLELPAMVAERERKGEREWGGEREGKRRKGGERESGRKERERQRRQRGGRGRKREQEREISRNEGSADLWDVVLVEISSHPEHPQTKMVNSS